MVWRLIRRTILGLGRKLFRRFSHGTHARRMASTLELTVIMKCAASRLLFALVLVCLPICALAQPFPNGPINVVVPLAPGDAAEISARTMGEEISKQLSTPVVAINRPGAGGAVAAARVVQARKAGQTLLFAQNSALTFRVVLAPQSATYDPRRDLVPLGIPSRPPGVFVVRADAPYKTFAEL